MSTRPIMSSTVRKPSAAMISRSSSAMNIMKWTTCSGLPSNFFRSTGSWVAMPTGQVFKWQTRIMMQPEATSAAEAKPYSSAPKSAAMATSRPVFSCPSVSTRMRPRRSLATRICCVSASPSSQGLPALAGLRALRHLDLQLVAVDEVVAGHAEAARGDLLDGAAAEVAVGVPLVAYRVLAALAGVRLAADPVHGDGEVLVRLAADRAERHGAGLEALHDLGGGLDLVDRDRLPRLEPEEPADGAQAPALVVHRRRVLLEHLVAGGAHRMLELGDRVRVVGVVLATAAPLVLAADVEVAVERGRDHVGVLVAQPGLARDDVEPDALDARRGPGEVALD